SDATIRSGKPNCGVPAEALPKSPASEYATCAGDANGLSPYRAPPACAPSWATLAWVVLALRPRAAPSTIQWRWLAAASALHLFLRARDAFLREQILPLASTRIFPVLCLVRRVPAFLSPAFGPQ